MIGEGVDDVVESNSPIGANHIVKYVVHQSHYGVLCEVDGSTHKRRIRRYYSQSEFLVVYGLMSDEDKKDTRGWKQNIFDCVCYPPVGIEDEVVQSRRPRSQYLCASIGCYLGSDAGLYVVHEFAEYVTL